MCGCGPCGISVIYMYIISLYDVCHTFVHGICMVVVCMVYVYVVYVCVAYMCGVYVL